MKKNTMLKLKECLLEYQREYYFDSQNSNRQVISDLLDDIDGRLLIEQKKKTEVDFGKIFDLIDEEKYDEISKSHSKLDITNLLKLVNTFSSKRINLFDNLENMSLTDLKVIYYLLTKDRENAAIKAKDKRNVLNAVRDAFLTNERRNKMGLS